MRRLGARLTIVAAAIATTLLLLEAATRVVLSLDRNFLDENLIRTHTPGDRELTLLDLIRLHPDDRVVYELRPGLSGRFLGHNLQTNALGMRDVERHWEKPPGTFRVAALGDSHTFGWGVDREQTWSAVLERLLAEALSDHRVEVWNFGVPGYNTVQEVRALELRLDRLRPDIVVINYVSNDMDLPNFLANPPALTTWRRSFLLDLVGRRLSTLDDRHRFPAGLVGVEPDARTGRYRLPENSIPEQYRPLNGWKNMEGAFLHLVSLSREHGFKAVVLFNPDDYRPRLQGWTHDVRLRPERQLGSRIEEAGALVVDVQDRVFAYLSANDLDNRALWIRDQDSHTNPVRHRLVAEELLEQLEDAGLLPSESP